MNNANDDDFRLFDLVINSVGKPSRSYHSNALSNRRRSMRKRFDAAQEPLYFQYELFS